MICYEQLTTQQLFHTTPNKLELQGKEYLAPTCAQTLMAYNVMLILIFLSLMMIVLTRLNLILIKLILQIHCIKFYAHSRIICTIPTYIRYDLLSDAWNVILFGNGSGLIIRGVKQMYRIFWKRKAAIFNGTSTSTKYAQIDNSFSASMIFHINLT